MDLSYEPQIQLSFLAIMPLDKSFYGRGQILVSRIAAPTNLARDIGRHVIRPMLCGIERDDADWIAVLACNHVLNDRFEIAAIDVSLSIGPADRTKVIDH